MTVTAAAPPIKRLPAHWRKLAPAMKNMIAPVRAIRAAMDKSGCRITRPVTIPTITANGIRPFVREAKVSLREDNQ